MTDYSELKRLAEAATPGEWNVDDNASMQRKVLNSIIKWW
jgi:hypothetical protein